MKILFSDNTLWGLLNFRGAIIDHFIKKGHEVTLVAPQDNMSDPRLIPSRVKYIPIELSRSGTNPVNELKYYRSLKGIYKRERPDYIFHYTIKPNIYGTFAAKSLGIPSTAMIAGLGHVYTQGGIGNKIARLMYKRAMRHPQNVLALNQSNYDTLVENGVVRKNKLILLKGGEGVDLEKLTALPMPQNEKPRFLMIARVLYDKGYKEFVEAAKVLGDKADFYLMGPIDANPEAVSRETIQSDVNSGAIRYIEFSPNVQEEIIKADAIVLPSYHEGLSRVLMEALAFARPIITTDIPGCRETVEEGQNGYLVEPKNSQSLASAFERFIDLNSTERIQMSMSSRVIAESLFDVKSVINIYDQIINSVTK